MATLNYASYDAATGAYTQQTQTQFYDSLTADIQRALDATNEPKADRPPKGTKKENYRHKPVPQHGLADFLDVNGGLQAPPAPVKKKAKKPVVEKFSLDEV